MSKKDLPIPPNMPEWFGRIRLELNRLHKLDYDKINEYIEAAAYAAHWLKMAKEEKFAEPAFDYEANADICLDRMGELI